MRADRSTRKDLDGVARLRPPSPGPESTALHDPKVVPPGVQRLIALQGVVGNRAVGTLVESQRGLLVAQRQLPERAGELPVQRAKKKSKQTAKGKKKSKRPAKRKKKGGKPKEKQAVGAPCSARAKACFSISRRTAWMIKDGKAIADFPALGGRPGAQSDTGKFEVLYHDRDHISGELHAPMPWTVMYNSKGEAFHQGSLVKPSHGCVHLRKKDAIRMFFHLKNGDRVEIVP